MRLADGEDGRREMLQFADARRTRDAMVRPPLPAGPRGPAGSGGEDDDDA